MMDHPCAALLNSRMLFFYSPSSNTTLSDPLPCISGFTKWFYLRVFTKIFRSLSPNLKSFIWIKSNPHFVSSKENEEFVSTRMWDFLILSGAVQSFLIQFHFTGIIIFRIYFETFDLASLLWRSNWICDTLNSWKIPIIDWSVKLLLSIFNVYQLSAELLVSISVVLICQGLMVAQKEAESKELLAKLHQERMDSTFQRDMLQYLIQDKVDIEIDDSLLSHRNGETWIGSVWSGSASKSYSYISSSILHIIIIIVPPIFRYPSYISSSLLYIVILPIYCHLSYISSSLLYIIIPAIYQFCYVFIHR